jgi:hypothetical protein
MPGADSQQRQSGRRLDFGFMEGQAQASGHRMARQPFMSIASLFSANWLTNVAAAGGELSWRPFLIVRGQ